jgi:hypothetical protein
MLPEAIIRRRKPANALMKKYEAGEGRSHAPGRYPSPASLAGAGRDVRLPIPQQTDATSTPPDPPRVQAHLKEWQNVASRMEFSDSPHLNRVVCCAAHNVLIAREQSNGRQH